MADDELQRLLVLMAEHDLEELELERAGLRVRLRKRSGRGGRDGRRWLVARGAG